MHILSESRWRQTGLFLEKARKIGLIFYAHAAARAVFPNPDGRLLSGSTGRLTIPYQQKQAIVIPQAALLQSRLSRSADHLDLLQGQINLYKALGGN